MGNLLFIGAHPDDETFFAAGTMARYAASGSRVAVVCATRGHEGKTAGLCTRKQLPTVRERELRSAMQILGVQDVTVLPYLDKQLADAPVAEMRHHLVGAIRRVQPDVLITFDPHGGNQHADHIAIHRFASDAVTIAPDPRWYPELGSPFEVSRILWTPPTFIYKLTPDRAIHHEPGFDFVLDVRRWSKRKADAFEAHATQFPGLKRLFFDDPNGQRTFGFEAFRFAAGLPPPKLPSDDLFAGLENATPPLPFEAQHGRD